MPRCRLAAQLSTQADGCIERFFRTLKEQLLWVRRFEDLEELQTALAEFQSRYNQRWIVGRLGYRTPAQARMAAGRMTFPGSLASFQLRSQASCC